LYISLADHEKTLQPALTPQIFPNPPRLYHIVLDPGHGGKDPGARNRALRLDEKNLTLDLARRLQRRLEARGYRVTLTRTTDTFLSLSERAAMANRLRADLFISLHCNAADATSVRGVETYAFTPRHQPSTARASLHASDNRDYPANRHDPWNLAVGLAIQRSLVDSTRAPDRGVKRGRWTVLQDLQMPGVLVECGFLTHSDEARNLGSTAYRDRLADAITDGVHAYQLTLNRIRGR
jgi:N-acetylmuramoyl-L-alanine amidase